MKVKIPEVTRSKYSIQVIDAIFSKPMFSSTYFVKAFGTNRMAAKRILTDLTDDRILEVVSEGKGSKPTVYAFRELLRIIDRP